MPSRTLPTITRADVETHNTAKSCYVTVGTKVFDVTSFLDDHPGGGDLILEYGGKDVEEILKDEVSHTHSEAAYEMLDECLVGFMPTDAVLNGATKSGKPGEIVPLPPSKEGQQELSQANGKVVYAATGMSSEEDLSRETDVVNDYKTHKFLDLSRPLFSQVWYGGFSKEFYLEQVHRPRHYRGGDSAPLFGNFLEPLTKTPWWVIPTVWLPPVAYGTYLGAQALGASTVPYWCLGVAIWTFVEYLLHRFLFHLDEYVLRSSTHNTQTNNPQMAPRQPRRPHPALPPPRHPPLPSHGPLPPRHAAHPLRRPRRSLLQARPHRLLLQLVRRRHRLLRWYLWLRLLRPHALLPAPPQSARLVPRTQEVPSRAPLCRLSEWLWCYEPLLGLGVQHGAGASAEGCEDGVKELLVVCLL